MAEPERPSVPDPLDLLRDKRAVVDMGLGPVVFVVANAIWGLEPAAYAAVGLAVLVAVWRLLQRAPLTNALGGVLGTGLAVFIALRTGSAEGFFIPRALQNTVLALAFGLSVLFRRPLLGYVAMALYRYPGTWHHDRRVRRVFAEATLAFAAVFAIRALVYTVFIVLGREGALAAAVVVLGWPAFLGATFFAYRWVPRRLKGYGLDPETLQPLEAAGSAGPAAPPP